MSLAAIPARRALLHHVLAGIGLNAVLGWWWADPLAALGVSVILVREGREGWSGEDHDD